MSFQEWNKLNTFYDRLIKIVLHEMSDWVPPRCKNIGFMQQKCCWENEKKIILIFFSVTSNIFKIVSASKIKKHMAPPWNFLGVCNAALDCIRMKMLHRGPKRNEPCEVTFLPNTEHFGLTEGHTRPFKNSRWKK